MFGRRETLPRDVSPAMADAQAAYERGRQDERAARQRRPVLMTLLFLCAAAGAAILGVAAWEGSFGRGGQVVDRSLSAAADQAEPAVRGAAADARQAIGNTGRAASNEAERTAP